MRRAICSPIKMSGHPPFGAQVMLNGHEYVACQAQKAGIDFNKQDNCFTMIPNPADLAHVADTLSRNEIAGRLLQVCERWIYTTCLCFALDLEEQERTTFHYRQPGPRLSRSASGSTIWVGEANWISDCGATWAKPSAGFCR
jgi:hypothetical protein